MSKYFLIFILLFIPVIHMNSQNIIHPDQGMVKEIVHFYTIEKNAVYWAGTLLKEADPETFEVVGHPYSSYGKDKAHVYFEGMILAEIDPITFEALTEGYYRDDKHILAHNKILEKVDAATFVIINSIYTKDKNHVYMYGNDQIIEGADPATFQVMNGYYAKDKNSVYWRYTLLADSNPRSFKLIDQELGYAKDKNYVYRNYIKTIVRDPNSFELINRSFSKDKYHVYCGDEHIVEGADPKTFKVINEKEGYASDKNFIYHGMLRLDSVDLDTFEILTNHLYTKDKGHVYFMDKIIEGADAVSFTADILYYGKDKKHIYKRDKPLVGDFFYPLPDVGTFSSIAEYTGESSTRYYKDNKYVYYHVPVEIRTEKHYYTESKLKRFKNADPASFTILSYNLTKDKDYVYWKDITLEDADPASFEIISGYYSKDRDNVWYESKRIEGADPISFVILIHGTYVKDKNNVWYKNNKIKDIDPETAKIEYNCLLDKKSVFREDEKIEGLTPEQFRESRQNRRSLIQELNSFEMM